MDHGFKIGIEDNTPIENNDDLMRAKKNVLKDLIKKYNLTEVYFDDRTIDITDVTDEEISKVYVQIHMKLQEEIANDMKELEKLHEEE